ncbi:YceI family protein [Oceanihabitans sp.]|nr:YceI family protein [Oceanihabitans sp.]
MKKFFFIIMLFLSLAFAKNVVIKSTSVVISSQSQLIIKGSTNVNEFKCHFNIEEVNNPIPLSFVLKEDRLIFEKALLMLDNSCFDCGSRVINKDFMNLLKSEEYPKIVLELKEIKKDSRTDCIVHALIEIVIAGESKSYFIPVELKDDKIINVTGALNLNICDFNLEPPKKALGLIVVSDIIKINFDLVVEEK